MKMHVIFGKSLFNNVRPGSLRFRSMLLLMLSMCILLSAVPLEAQAAGGAYTIKWYAADPAVNTGPYLPTYEKLKPSELQCGEPLLNAVAYASPANPSDLDAVTSLAPKDMMLGQIVPFEIEITVNGDTSPENGVITFTGGWSTHTTSGGDFGYDPDYKVYCAFVDTTDPVTNDPGNDAKVDDYISTVVGTGSKQEIQGSFKISGLDDGDIIIVEVWVVLKSTIPAGTTGNVQSALLSANTFTTNSESIKVGKQTVPLLKISDFYKYNFELSPECNEPFLLTVTSPYPDGLSLRMIWKAGETEISNVLVVKNEGVYTYAHEFFPSENGEYSVSIYEYPESDGTGTLIGEDSYTFQLICDGPEFPIGSFVFLLLVGVMYLAMRGKMAGFSNAKR